MVKVKILGIGISLVTTITTTITTKDNYIPMTIKIYETCIFTSGPS